MWYIVENTRFFLLNLIATTVVLAAVSFAIPPIVNWLSNKIPDKGH
jgi:hypothetical protein